MYLGNGDSFIVTTVRIFDTSVERSDAAAFEVHRSSLSLDGYFETEPIFPSRDLNPKTTHSCTRRRRLLN